MSKRGRPAGSKNKIGHGAGRPPGTTLQRAMAISRSSTGTSNPPPNPYTVTSERPMHPLFQRPQGGSHISNDRSEMAVMSDDEEMLGEPAADAMGKRMDKDLDDGSFSLNVQSPTPKTDRHASNQNEQELVSQGVQLSLDISTDGYVCNSTAAVIQPMPDARQVTEELARISNQVDEEDAYGEDIDEAENDDEEEDGGTVSKPSTHHLSYLRIILEQIKKEEQQNFEKLPHCVAKGDGWVNPCAPHQALCKELDPLAIVRPRIYVHIPDAFADLKCPSCTTNSKLVRYGWSGTFRRVVCVSENWYMISRRYQCQSCQKTYVGHVQKIMSQLPRSFQELFPAHLTQRSGISRTLFDLIQPLFMNRSGPQAMANMLSELHKKRYDRLHLSYLEAVEKRVKNPFVFDNHQTQQIRKFPDYEGEFGGFTPSARYLSSVFIAVQKQHEARRNAHTAMLPANVLASDHSFKLPKRIAKVDGCSVFTAVLSLCNEFGEIRFHQLTSTKSLQEVSPQIKQMLNSLAKYGHGQPKLLFVDDPRGERSFFEQAIPSLTLDVHHRTKFDHLQALEVPAEVLVIQVTSAHDCEELLNLHIFNQLDTTTDNSIAIGFDCEWSFDPQTKLTGRVATVQIATAEVILVILLSAIKKLPTALQLVMEDARILKVGRNVSGDLSKLVSDYGLRDGARVCGKVKLGQLAKRLQFVADGRTGLDGICASVLGQRLDKPVHVRISSDWEAVPLSDEQLSYAALDAYASWAIHAKLMTHSQKATRIEAEMQVSIIAPDDKGTAVAQGSVKAAVYGTVFDGVKLTQDSHLVQITQVMIPGRLLPRRKDGKSFGQLELLEQIVIPTKLLRLPRPTHCDVTISSLDVASVNTAPHDLDAAVRAIVDNIPPVNSQESSHSNDLRSQDEEMMPLGASLTECLNCESDDQREWEQEAGRVKGSNSLSSPGNPVNDSTSTSTTTSRPSRVLQDLWHLMDRITVPRRHGALPEFARMFRDALFVVDSVDKAKVTEVLERRRGMTWDKAVSRHPRWVWKRVRRYVPNPSVLRPLVEEVFAKFGPILCAKTGRPLFSVDAVKQGKAILRDIDEGFVSDPPDIPLYYKTGHDQYGLVKYRCIRGTNLLEGGFHQKMIAKFSSYQASVPFAVQLMGEYVLRHNMNVGHLNRHNRRWAWHFDLQLIDEVHATYLRLEKYMTMPARLTIWCNAQLYEASSETSIIAKFTAPLQEQLGMQKHELRIGSQVGVIHPRHNATAELQGTRYAVLPVHTDEEREMFRLAVTVELAKPGKPDWKRVVVLWNQRANGRSIFYKIPQYLESWHRTWQQFCIQANTTRPLRTNLRTLQIRLRSAERVPEIVPSVGISAPPQLIAPEYVVNPFLVHNLVEAPTDNDLDMTEAMEEPPIDSDRHVAALQIASNPASDTAEPGQTSKRQKKCKNCSSETCKGRGGVRYCQGIGFLGEDRLRLARRCGVCQSTDCKGRGKRNLCPMANASQNNSI